MLVQKLMHHVFFRSVKNHAKYSSIKKLKFIILLKEHSSRDLHEDLVINSSPTVVRDCMDFSSSPSLLIVGRKH